MINNKPYITYSLKSQANIKGLPVIKTPYQGLNAILGEADGLIRGTMLLIGALEGNYAEDLMHDLQVSHSLYNTPVLLDDTKRALVMSVVFADDVTMCFERLETIIKHNTEHDSVDALLHNGFKHYVITVMDKNSYTLELLFQQIQELETQHYEIHQICIEDLSRISNLDAKGNPQSISEMLRRVRDFFKPRGALVITTCELGDDAQALRDNVPNGYLDKAVAINSYKHGSRLDQEADTVILTSLDYGELTMCCIKNRGSRTKKSYTTYEYIPEKGVLFDMGGESKALSLTKLPTSWYTNLL